MEAEAPAIFHAIEHSALGALIRQSVWIYPTANTAHILGLVFFAAAVAIMDLRLLGAFSSTPAAQIVFPARRVAILAFLVQAASGIVLFIAEAGHIAVNPVFQLKGLLIVLALANALILGRLSQAALGAGPGQTRVPARLRTAAKLSIALWLAVAAAGRLIAYA
jgi:hypothetical protein